jgi:hypothetical protein
MTLPGKRIGGKRYTPRLQSTVTGAALIQPQPIERQAPDPQLEELLVLAFVYPALERARHVLIEADQREHCLASPDIAASPDISVVAAGHLAALHSAVQIAAELVCELRIASRAAGKAILHRFATDLQRVRPVQQLQGGPRCCAQVREELADLSTQPLLGLGG